MPAGRVLTELDSIWRLETVHLAIPVLQLETRTYQLQPEMTHQRQLFIMQEYTAVQIHHMPVYYKYYT